MDVRLPLTSAGICLALLMSGCSPSDEKTPGQPRGKDCAVREKSLDAIKDPKLKDAVAELGGSLLLLERAQLKLDSKPVETEYGEDALAVLKHYPTPQALVDTYINGLFVLHKDSSSDYLTDLQPVFPFNFSIPAAFLFPHGLEWQSVTLSNKRVIAFQPEWSETDPGIQLSPSSSNLTNPDDLTVTYPFIEGLDVDIKNQPQPVSLQGKGGSHRAAPALQLRPDEKGHRPDPHQRQLERHLGETCGQLRRNRVQQQRAASPRDC